MYLQNSVRAGGSVVDGTLLSAVELVQVTIHTAIDTDSRQVSERASQGQQQLREISCKLHRVFYT